LQPYGLFRLELFAFELLGFIEAHTAIDKRGILVVVRHFGSKHLGSLGLLGVGDVNACGIRPCAMVKFVDKLLA
jgi:hypothetical protein